MARGGRSSSAQLSLGQVVRVSSSFNVRANAVYTATCYGQATNGAVGIVRGGPTTGLIGAGTSGTWYDIEWGPDSSYTHPTSPSCPGTTNRGWSAYSTAPADFTVLSDTTLAGTVSYINSTGRNVRTSATTSSTASCTISNGGRGTVIGSPSTLVDTGATPGVYRWYQVQWQAAFPANGSCQGITGYVALPPGQVASYLQTAAATHTLSFFRNVDGARSQNNAAVTVNPTDINFQSSFTQNSVGGDSTTFATYNTGTSVTITAASSVGGKNFQRWSDCGATTYTTSTSYSPVVMDQERGYCAEYVTPVTIQSLEVYSTVDGGVSSGAPVTLSPTPISGGSSTTPISAANYAVSTTVVNVTANAWSPRRFTGWNTGTGPTCSLANGNANTTCGVTMSTSRLVTATYATSSELSLFARVDGVGTAISGFSRTAPPPVNAPAPTTTTPTATIATTAPATNAIIETYDVGQYVKLTAAATYGSSTFTSWSGPACLEGSNSTLNCTIRMAAGGNGLIALYTSPATSALNFTITGGSASLSNATLYTDAGCTVASARSPITGATGSFTALSPGTYCVEARTVNPSFLPSSIVEYWGKNSITLTTGATGNITIERTEPTATAVQFINAANQIIGGGTTPVNAPLTVRVPVSNPLSSTQRGVQAQVDFRLSTSSTIQKTCTTPTGNVSPGTTVNLECSFTPDSAGTWQRQVKLLSDVTGGNPTTTTDSKPFSTTDVLNVSAAAAVSLAIVETTVAGVVVADVSPSVPRGRLVEIKVRATSDGVPVVGANVTVSNANGLGKTYSPSTGNETTSTDGNGDLLYRFYARGSTNLAQTITFSATLSSQAATVSKSILITQPNYGVTVIIHGYETSQLNYCSDTWLGEMAKSIIYRAQFGKIYCLNYRNNILFDETPPGASDPSGEIVLIVNWSEASNNTSQGFGEAVAHAVHALLVGGTDARTVGTASSQALPALVTSNVVPVHVIAHSFGTGVANQLVRRLNFTGHTNSHVTLLDSHDFNQGLGGIDGANGIPQIVVGAGGFVAARGVESFYQTASSFPIPRGRCIQDAWNLDLSTLASNLRGQYPSEVTKQHSVPWGYYIGTIDPLMLAGISNYTNTGSVLWYSGSRTAFNHGFAKSRLGGASASDFLSASPLVCSYNGDEDGVDSADKQVQDAPQSGYEANSVFDGSFEANIGESDQHPGFQNPQLALVYGAYVPSWDTKPVQVTGRTGTSTFASGILAGYDMLTHLTLLPYTAKSIRFDARAKSSVGTGGIDVYLDDTALPSTSLVGLDTAWIPNGVCLTIPPTMAGRARVIRLHNSSAEKILIDNIQISPTVCSGSLSLTAYSTVDGARTSGVHIQSSPPGSGSPPVSTLVTSTNNAAQSAYALYNANTSIVLAAPLIHPSSGASLGSWSGCDTTNLADGTCTLVLNGHRGITANYATTPASYSLAKSAVNGTISANPSQQAYSSGQVVTLTPSPSLGYYFVSWTGDCTGTGACQLTMNQNHTVSATFAACTLSVSPTSSPLLAASSATGQSIAVQTQTGSGCQWGVMSWPSTFVSVSTLSGVGPSTINYSVAPNTSATGQSGNIVVALGSLTASHVVSQAAASAQSYPLTTTVNPSGAGNVAPTSGSYASGTTIVLSASASDGYYFTNWSGDCTGSAGCSVTMSAARAVTANFGACSYALSTASANLASTATSGSFTVTTQAGCAWAPIVSQPWVMTSVSGNTVNYSVSANGTSVTRNATITVGSQVFTINQAPPASTGPSISINPGALNFGSVTVGQTSAGQVVTVQNTGNANLTVSSATTAAPFAVSANTCGTVVPSGNCTITVTFAPSASSSANGSLTINSNIAGAVTTVPLSGVGVSPVGSTYTLSVSAGTGGTTAPNGASQRSSGESITVNATPNSGFTFTNWTGYAGCGASALCTFAMPSAAVALTANFTAVPTCTYSFNPTSVATFGPAAATGSFAVVTQSGCAIAAPVVVASGGWLSASLSGSTVNFAITTNATTTARSGTITVGSQVMTITQNGSGGACAVQPAPGKDTFFGTIYQTQGQPTWDVMFTGGWGDSYSSLVEIDVSALPPAATTQSAWLWLYVAAKGVNDPALQILRITSPWTAAGVTSTTVPTTTPYAAGPTGVLQGSWYKIDITSMYKDWKNGVYPNYGVMLSPTFTTNAALHFSSSESAIASRRPKLVVLHSGGSCASPPVQASCVVDVKGNGSAAVLPDGLLMLRYLLGFRGSALTDGLNIVPPRNTSSAIESFLADNDYSAVGSTASANVDGLILLRLLQGVPDSALLTGINLPGDAVYRDAAAIRANVNARCGTSF